MNYVWMVTKVYTGISCVSTGVFMWYSQNRVKRDSLTQHLKRLPECAYDGFQWPYTIPAFIYGVVARHFIRF